jgi:hypothetical protein
VFAQGQWGGFPCTQPFPLWAGLSPCGMSLAPTSTTVATRTLGSVLTGALGPFVFVIEVLAAPSPLGGKAEIEFEKANQIRIQKMKSGTWRDPLSPECRAAKQRCIETCSDTTLPTKDHGWEFVNCVNRCMEQAGCRER